MTAHALWLWLHEAMQGIPAWTLSPDGENERYVVLLDENEHALIGHDFDPKWANDDQHQDCFAYFTNILRNGWARPGNGVPEATLVLLHRARAAWDGQVYGDERDEGEARVMKEGE